MNRLPYAVLFVLISTAGLGVHFLGAAERQPKASAETVSIEKLLERIEKLERRVAELEQDQQRQIASLFEQKSRAEHGRQVPSDWMPWQFNGQTIYIVPLGPQHSQSRGISK